MEDRNAGTLTCTGEKRAGYLPWVTLAVNKTDSWGRIFRYSASLTFTNASAVFSTSSGRDITLKTRDSAGTLINQSNIDDIPAVIVSTGPNGIYGTLDNGSQLLPNVAGNYPNVVDQQKNAYGDGKEFINRDSAAKIAPNDAEFDDLVVWLSPTILYSRLAAAGRLP